MSFLAPVVTNWQARAVHVTPSPSYERDVDIAGMETCTDKTLERAFAAFPIPFPVWPEWWVGPRRIWHERVPPSYTRGSWWTMAYRAGP